MATKPVPSLDTRGWVDDFSEKVDRLLAHFFLSDYNQTYFYFGNVTSLVKIIEERGNYIDAVISDINDKLGTYLGRYFQGVTVTSSVKARDEFNLLKDTIVTVAIQIEDPSGVKNFSEVFQGLDGVFKKVADKNNAD